MLDKLRFVVLLRLDGNLCLRLDVFFHSCVSSALFVMAVWALFFAWSFIETAIGNPYAATTGIPIYLGLAVACLLIGLVHRRSAQDALHR